MHSQGQNSSPVGNKLCIICMLCYLECGQILFRKLYASRLYTWHMKYGTYKMLMYSFFTLNLNIDSTSYVLDLFHLVISFSVFQLVVKRPKQVLCGARNSSCLLLFHSFTFIF
jgi:hypothetical protein